MERIRDQIKKIQNEVKDAQDLFPARASELLMTLSALLGNINDEIRDSEMKYISPEYKRKIEARNTKELAIELMRSLKYFLRAREDEFKNTM